MTPCAWTRFARTSLLVAALLPACGGSALNNGNAPSGGAGNAPSGGAGGASAGAGGSAPNNAPCTGTLDEVKAASGETCPDTLCAAGVWASACSSLPADLSSSTASECGDLRTFTINFSAKRGKACHYAVTRNAEPSLVGAEAWNDTATFCDGTSQRIDAGALPTNCPEPAPRPLCDGAGGAGAPGAPPAACFDLFNSVCEPCCPATQPDCSDKPDGYPGYACVSTANAFCSCTCGAGMWNCAC